MEKQIESIIAGIKKGETQDNLEIEVENTLADLSDFEDKAAFLDKLNTAFFNTDDTVSAGVNLFYHSFKDHIKKRKIAFLKKANNRENKTPEITYGTHQENRQWVVNTHGKVRPDWKSNNKALEEVQNLYKKEFDLKIAKTTIRRLIGDLS